MKNTRISDNYVLCFGCRCSCSCSSSLVVVVAFAVCLLHSRHGLKISLVSYWTHCERWTKCTASVAYRKLNWNSTEAAVPSTGNDGNGKASKAKRGEAMCARERGRQAGDGSGSSRVEQRQTYTHAHTGGSSTSSSAEANQANERTNEWTARPSNNTHSKHSAALWAAQQKYL